MDTQSRDVTPCVPTVRQSHSYPHELEMSCWEHGLICTYGHAVKAVDVAADLARHHAEIAATCTSEGAACPA